MSQSATVVAGKIQYILWLLEKEKLLKKFHSEREFNERVTLTSGENRMKIDSVLI